MVEISELVAYLGFGLFIGAFFGFVLSFGDIMYAGVGAVVLAVLAVIYLFTVGQGGRPAAV